MSERVTARYCGHTVVGVVESTRLTNVGGTPVELCWVIFDEPLVMNKSSSYGLGNKKQTIKYKALIDKLMIQPL